MAATFLITACNWIKGAPHWARSSHLPHEYWEAELLELRSLLAARVPSAQQSFSDRMELSFAVDAGDVLLCLRAIELIFPSSQQLSARPQPTDLPPSSQRDASEHIPALSHVAWDGSELKVQSELPIDAEDDPWELEKELGEIIEDVPELWPDDRVKESEGHPWGP